MLTAKLRTLVALAAFLPLTPAAAQPADEPPKTTVAEPVVQAAAKQLSAERRARLLSLLELSGMRSAGPKILDSILDGFRKMRSDVPPGLFDSFREGTDLAPLYEQLLLVYDKHFTDEEADALIALYSTPVGQSIVAKQVGVAQDTMSASGDWGDQVGQALIAKITAFKLEEQAAKARAVEREAASAPPRN
jgi:hypothetical protein